MQAPKEDDERPPGTEDDPEVEGSAADPSKQQEAAAAAVAAAAAQVSSRQCSIFQRSNLQPQTSHVVLSIGTIIDFRSLGFTDFQKML